MSQSIQRIGVIGAGTMGSSIAALFLGRGIEVVLIDPAEKALARARAAIQSQVQSLFPDSAAQTLELLRLDTSLEAVTGAQMVIEAVPEKLELKRGLFARLEEICGPETIFATNTSGLSINAIAENLTYRGRFLGTHFFTPADVIPLVEVVRGENTAEHVVARTMETLREAGKRPVLVRYDIPGFIANRIQHALAREAISLLEKGVASAEDIDEVVKWSLGIRLAITGPLEQRDINGLDVHHAIASYLYPQLENRTTPSALLEQKVKDGQLGLKSGQGFYSWEAATSERDIQRKSETLRELAAWLGNQGDPQS